MDVPPRALDEPVADHRRLVGGVVVHHEMHVEITGNGLLNLVQELPAALNLRSQEAGHEMGGLSGLEADADVPMERSEAAQGSL